ncbi:MAG: ParB/RepB/Spo0J family partition protein [Rhodospirillaceae bacterium]|jgi:ParB family transcriptional regulator, chromosome partitioning protein|nr:ParB/RepB/Spo0J family partition protein [Rhodospirillaceae bacterium]MBT4220184.1 ParB/RepB/Spo0J family partition protein [Rhodospirillaceae bacterium]MBT4464160.1 ParB/RepB/Spo0J family partition protein [Rhodospirillaceae bacterium]MBT5013701.1 ParB/RepB/Spo0J family partition protein [Rhodospirillaceae bacterium]MBT5309410.1 ParB/RepB/Spo0J family partition protein [Rhodospirillaceae bacterium]
MGAPADRKQTNVKDDKKRKLGRGLSALLGEEVVAETVSVSGTVATSGKAVRTLPIGQLQPGKFQPRHIMDDALIDDLSRSISEKGILQPLLVRPLDGPDSYEIIAGERRWRAAQKARQHEVPVIIKQLDDRETLEIALIENLQRQDLSAMEEAEGYQRLMDEFSHTQEELAKAMGKSRSHVANMMRLLGLPDAVRKMIDEGQLSAGHGRALLTSDNPLKLAKTVIKQGLNVRQTEKLTQQKGPSAKSVAAAKDPDTVALENDLAAMLGLKVDIRFKNGRGALTIHYNDLGQLDDVLARLSSQPKG